MVNRQSFYLMYREYSKHPSLSDKSFEILRHCLFLIYGENRMREKVLCGSEVWISWIRKLFKCWTNHKLVKSCWVKTCRPKGIPTKNNFVKPKEMAKFHLVLLIAIVLLTSRANGNPKFIHFYKYYSNRKFIYFIFRAKMLLLHIEH
jgi:hypothetical protein